MIEIFEYLQHFQRQVEIFKKHVNTGISSFHNTGFAECLQLFVDSEKIAWVLTNLLSNAIRYSPENGRIIIGARQTEDNHIEMYVRDFGKGIDPRYHQSIFDHYFRVPGTKVQGSGLGLSISKDFVEAHGGTLTVESEIGKGSCFTLRLKS